MTVRSRLLSNTLRAWDSSLEAPEYLGWLIDYGAEVDGGDVLREAVLQVTEDRPLDEHERKKAEALEKLFAELPTVEAEELRAARELTAQIIDLNSQSHQAIRRKTEALRVLREQLGLSRFEVLKLVAAQMEAQAGKQGLWNRIPAIEELSARLSALRRTTVELMDIEAEWRKSVPDVPFSGQVPESQDPSQDLDRYYSYQVVARLERIVDRASALAPVELKVASDAVRVLFRQAHDVYLYGSDVACIALCGSLIEHALKDKLPPVLNERRDLGALIERASQEKVLEGPELESARKVARSRNKAMHDLSSAPKTAPEILVCTRLVLSNLYRTDSVDEVSC